MRRRTMLESTRGMLFPSSLSGLLLQPFVRIADAFLLVWIRLLQRPDVRGDLPDQLAVDPGHNQVRQLIHTDGDSRRKWILDRMRKPQSEHNRILAGLRAVSDSHNIQFTRKPLRHAAHR